MEIAAIWRDVAGGLLFASAVAAWVPISFWQRFFLTGHETLAKIWGPLIGPFVSVLSFVCSIGNVPLAAVLWRGGISFGGVIAFIFADLITLPILAIYHKYYGTRMALFLFFTFYAAITAAGYIIEFVFGRLGLIPARAAATTPEAGISWDYTTWLNIVFLAAAGILAVRFARSGGLPMLRMIGGAPPSDDGDGARSRSVAAAGHQAHRGQCSP